MADVRSLLKAERAARRITHPNASYTSDGKLSCNLCETLVKSEAQWGGHLHSTQHTLRSQRAQDAKVLRSPDANVGSKKRKAESLEVGSLAAHGGKKRVRSGEDEGEEFGPKLDDGNGEEVPEAVPSKDVVQPAAPVADPNAPADADELDAFERELAAMEAESNANRASALQSAATISAAPMTAEELAAQAREEGSAQRGKRDQELEDEKEDASRAMEDELDEMDVLEERVKKLRERREKLRQDGLGSNTSGVAQASAGDVVDNNDKVDEGESDSYQEDEEDDEEDQWRFGAD